ncbi:hypothetical protein CPZ06_10060 [Lactobacillus acidophilus]|nr:hypothetical protein CPZ06_10060 [Lactobacillus acidophilus]
MKLRRKPRRAVLQGMRGPLACPRDAERKAKPANADKPQAADSFCAEIDCVHGVHATGRDWSAETLHETTR